MSRMRKVSDFKWNLTSVKCVLETATGMGGSADRIGSLERKEGVGCQFPGGRTALLCFFKSGVEKLATILRRTWHWTHAPLLDQGALEMGYES